MIKAKFNIQGIVDHKKEIFKEEMASLWLSSSSYFNLSGRLDFYLFAFSNCHSQVNLKTKKETKALTLYCFKILPPGMAFSMEALTSHNDIFLLYFSNDLINETASQYKISPAQMRTQFNTEAYLRKNNWLNEILHRYFFEIYTVGNLDNNASTFLEKEILKEVYYLGINTHTKYYDRLNIDSQFLSGKSELVNNLLLFIESNLSSSLSLNLVSKKVAASVSTIKRRFQNEMGVSVREYIQTRRLEEAFKLLGSQKINVNEACSRLGFQSSSSFNALFKKKYGIAPGKIKKK